MRERHESESQLIDRLVLGRPPSKEITRRSLELHADGWTHEEIGRLYGFSKDAIANRLSRARRAEATT